MSALIPINNINVNFEVIGGEIFTNSLQIAEVFEKEHKNIIRIIESLPSDEFRRRNFEPSSEVRKNGLFNKETKFYNLTRDGFSLLVMGFTGERAYQWKIEFINAFNKMESLIKSGEHKKEFTANEKFAQILSDLSQKSSEADEFKQKYYDSLERENALLRQINGGLNNELDLSTKLATKSTRLSEDEKKQILKLYKSGLSKAEISRQILRSETAVNATLKGVKVRNLQPKLI